MLTPSYGFCCTPLTITGLGQAGGFKHRRGDVDHVMELRANFTFSLDTVRPVDDGAVASAAPV